MSLPSETIQDCLADAIRLVGHVKVDGPEPQFPHPLSMDLGECEAAKTLNLLLKWRLSGKNPRRILDNLPEAPSMQTVYGRACLTAVTSTKHHGVATVCALAEPRFLRAASLREKCSYIFTDSGKPVAVQKNNGQDTALALDDFTVVSARGDRTYVPRGILFDTGLPAIPIGIPLDEYPIMEVGGISLSGIRLLRATTFTLPPGASRHLTSEQLQGCDQAQLDVMQQQIAGYIV
jgi:hypothetical protein